jgi:hypothetical protein
MRDVPPLAAPSILGSAAVCFLLPLFSSNQEATKTSSIYIDSFEGSRYGHQNS